jgi:hypothetical protein
MAECRFHDAPPPHFTRSPRDATKCHSFAGSRLVGMLAAASFVVLDMGGVDGDGRTWVRWLL